MGGRKEGRKERRKEARNEVKMKGRKERMTDNVPAKLLASAQFSATFSTQMITSHKNTSQAQWLNVSSMIDIYVGKVLVQCISFISNNKLRNRLNVTERRPPSSRRTFMNVSRPLSVKNKGQKMQKSLLAQ